MFVRQRLGFTQYSEHRKKPSTNHPVSAESDDEDDDPLSHAEAFDLCAKLSIYLQSLPERQLI